jgi:hypothetical protein
MVNHTSLFSGGEGLLIVQLFEGADNFIVSRFYRPTGRYADVGHGDVHDHGETDEHGHEDDDNDKQTHEGPGDDHEYNNEESLNEEEHDRAEESMEGEIPWEAENLYHLPSGEYDLTFEESADPTMKSVLVSNNRENPRKIARRTIENCESVDPGETVTGDETCYNLTLNQEGITHKLSVRDGGDYRLYTEHLPREFNMTLTRDGNLIDPLRTFVPGKGEYLGQHVDRVRVRAVQPPFDDIFKVMVTLLAVVGLGFLIGWKGPRWLG